MARERILMIFGNGKSIPFRYDSPRLHVAEKTVKMKFNETPFGIPVNQPLGPREPLFQKANKVFSASFMFQRECGVSNCCSLVNVVLRRCLRPLGFETNELLQVQYGRIQRYNQMDMPHVWLDIGGYVIDNTYLEIPIKLFTKMKKSAKYVPFTDAGDLSNSFLGDEETRAMGIQDHDYEVYIWCLNTSNEEKYMALSGNKAQLLDYQAKMMKFMKETFDVELPEVKKEKICWSCNQASESLKSCSKCKIAQYCNKCCQTRDWHKIHKRVCLPPNTR
ncbi:hypothetical protein LOTGIDRAFT_168530 [Lottia gigantea]|uniref:MYND-type domain-containing protein n=1 Tax=Lottia gigantea TaxID=225164 RepID=V3ZQ82_LOTGI|nr:hypothetical protein LOTGIDRAFT_168530 [Lottia gigantea]ESO84665.1 hypothetical protein LOTGIDRAFT_168530 [Lottia gigantea]